MPKRTRNKSRGQPSSPTQKKPPVERQKILNLEIANWDSGVEAGCRIEVELPPGVAPGPYLRGVRDFPTRVASDLVALAALRERIVLNVTPGGDWVVEEGVRHTVVGRRRGSKRAAVKARRSGVVTAFSRAVLTAWLKNRRPKARLVVPPILDGHAIPALKAALGTERLKTAGRRIVYLDPLVSLGHGARAILAACFPRITPNEIERWRKAGYVEPDF